ncbi:MAG: DNA polymerase III subunit beta [Candidatus Pelagibacterales bacterium]|nr:MAG: DNA polymerase III subunit beta [Pelagibacterales bacterium]
MEFTINRDIFLKTLGNANGIIEKKTTLPILSNILIEAKNSKIKITATDLDIIYFEEVSPNELKKEGSTTTSASILYDILRKLKPNTMVELSLQSSNKIKLVSENSKFNLLCLPADNFPLPDESVSQESFEVPTQKLLKLLNKTKISISNDETRHYLNGIYLHKTKLENKSFLCGVATDSHRLSSSSLEIDPKIHIEPIILPKKTIFQLILLLEQSSGTIKISNNKSKIKFEINGGVLISKVIDGRFPDYSKVIPKNNDKVLQIKLDEFRNSIERVSTVSSDRKKGLKMTLSKDVLQLSVNNPSSGEGTENINAKFNSSDLNISFNSRYLTDIASQVENEFIIINLKDSNSPVLVNDLSDKNSFYVVMPMKI